MRFSYQNAMRRRRRQRGRHTSATGISTVECVFNRLYGFAVPPEQRFAFRAAVEASSGEWFAFIAPGAPDLFFISTVNVCGSRPCTTDHRRLALKMLDTLHKLLACGLSGDKIRHSLNWPLPELAVGAIGEIGAKAADAA